jgi:hypothetical protein
MGRPVALTPSGAFVGPNVNRTRSSTRKGARRFAEYAAPPPSNPPELENIVPSVTMPDTLYAADRFTGSPKPRIFTAALTSRVIVAVCVMWPDFPVTVTEKGPVCVWTKAKNTSVLVVVVRSGLKKASTPFGNPDTDSDTWPVKPFTGAIVIVPLAVESWLMNTLLGVWSVKPGRARVT